MPPGSINNLEGEAASRLLVLKSVEVRIDEDGDSVAALGLRPREKKLNIPRAGFLLADLGGGDEDDSDGDGDGNDETGLGGRVGPSGRWKGT